MGKAAVRALSPPGGRRRGGGMRRKPPRQVAFCCWSTSNQRLPNPDSLEHCTPHHGNEPRELEFCYTPRLRSRQRRLGQGSRYSSSLPVAVGNRHSGSPAVSKSHRCPQGEISTTPPLLALLSPSTGTLYLGAGAPALKLAFKASAFIS